MFDDSAKSKQIKLPKKAERVKNKVKFTFNFFK